ncbi:MAG: hypothetical protein AB8F78_19000 [Saprospiraceae bacterium]
MPSDQLPAIAQSDPKRLEIRIALVQQELEEVQQKTRAFETVLRTRLSDVIVEAQELHMLYKQIKRAKKDKRLEQKRRGKNYQEPTGLQSSPKKQESEYTLEEQKEKKRLYREAMLHVHPDKFSMSETDTEAATAITSRLIEIYKTGSLKTLQAYHAHIFSGNANITLGEAAAEVQVLAQVQGTPQRGTAYLQLELERLEAELSTAKTNHLYKVTMEYKNPLTFVDELKEYYDDRIMKLKKRTRKGL